MAINTLTTPLHNIDVSIVVPVYNVESYVSACLQSLLEQTGLMIEIICVNDGSTDTSPEIVESFTSNNPQLRVIHTPNSGLSAARNIGLHFARGKFIYFIDSDDQLTNPNALFELYEICEKHDLEVVYFNSVVDYENEQLKRLHPSYFTTRASSFNQPVDGLTLLSHFFNSNSFTPVVWLGFYKHSFLQKNNILFEPGIIHEDNAFTFLIAVNAKRCFHVPKSYHKHLIRQGSIMTDLNKAKSFAGYAITLQIIQQVKFLGINHEQQNFITALAERYQLHCQEYLTNKSVLASATELVEHWPNLGQKIFMKMILDLFSNQLQAYQNGLFSASSALANPNSIEKRVTAPCSYYVDCVEFQSENTLVVIGWILLWNKIAPSTVKLYLNDTSSLIPIQFKTVQRDDVIIHFPSSNLRCGFRATFKLKDTSILEHAYLKGLYQGHIITEPIELNIT